MLATSSHPRFKMNWIQDDQDILAVRKLFEDEMEKAYPSDGTSADAAEDELDLPSKTTEALNELGLYLMDPGKSLDISASRNL